LLTGQLLNAADLFYSGDIKMVMEMRQQLKMTQQLIMTPQLKSCNQNKSSEDTIMDVRKACTILGLSITNVNINDIESRVYCLSQVFKLDRHPSDLSEYFSIMSQEVKEAAEYLINSINNSDNNLIEMQLYAGVKGLSRKRKYYDSNRVLAVAVKKIEHKYSWRTTPNPLFSNEEPETRYGTRVHLIVMNRTEEDVEKLYIGSECYLLDDCGHQYMPTSSSFYFEADNGSFQSQSGFLAPTSKTEGFILFPALRSGARKFVKWYLRGKFHLGNEAYTTNYVVKLI
jgi:hypothetical protein